MSVLPELESSIVFLISIPDWEPTEATPFQGFAFSLCENAGLLEFIRGIPSDVFELTPEYLSYRIARRIGGNAPTRWFGQSPRALKGQMLPDQLAFTIVLLDRKESFSDYESWVNACPAPVTVVAEDGGHIRYSELSLEAVRKRLLYVCDVLKSRKTVSGIEQAHQAISSWSKMPEQKLPYDLRGHGTVLPNVAALRIAGYDIWNMKPFDRLLEEHAYVDQICMTTNTVFDVRDANHFSEANTIFPRSLDLNIYCPATYDLGSAVQIRSDAERDTRRKFEIAVRALDKQSGYSFGLSSESQVKAIFGISLDDVRRGEELQPNPVTLMRQREVWLGIEAVSCLASSEMSAAVRLPNRMNRTKGSVRQFSQHYRADRPQMLKRAELFRDVQRALSDAFPEDFYALLERSRDGLRIIGDAHIEWLDVKGIPLGIRYNVARIPVTPGNLFISNIASRPNIMVEPDDLLDVLVISGLVEDDDVAKPFIIAFEQFGEQWRNKLRITRVRVTSKQELIDAINAFDGMIMVFDGHGSHKPDHPGVLWLDKVSIDVWTLRGEISRIPPIVILSACDTHAADRNHATVANGFLALGARSVFGSVFPLHASQAAIFTARLLYRVTEYVPAANELLGRSLTWLEVVSGMLRRQLTTDILRHLESEGLVHGDVELHHQVQRIVDSPRDDSFGDMQEFLISIGLDASRLDREIYKAISSSSTISYVHLGRPETIIIYSGKILRRLLGQDHSQIERRCSVKPIIYNKLDD